MEAVFVLLFALFFYLIYRGLRGKTQATKPEIPRHAKSYVLDTSTLLLVVFLCAVSLCGQVKKTNKTSAKVETTRVWHRHASQDEIEGDRVAYYLPSVEDESVRLLVLCQGGKVAGASLNFPFMLYGVTGSLLKYKSPTGDVKQLDLALADGSDAMFTTRADDLKPLVGGTFRVEDASAKFHTYHLPAVGTTPFDSGCKTESR
jgi:hypothetical protein